MNGIFFFISKITHLFQCIMYSVDLHITHEVYIRLSESVMLTPFIFNVNSVLELWFSPSLIQENNVS